MCTRECNHGSHSEVLFEDHIEDIEVEARMRKVGRTRTWMKRDHRISSSTLNHGPPDCRQNGVKVMNFKVRLNF